MSSEIELLRQKKALELRKKMILSQEKPAPVAAQIPKLSSREVVQKILAGRGVEVLETPRVVVVLFGLFEGHGSYFVDGGLVDAISLCESRKAASTFR